MKYEAPKRLHWVQVRDAVAGPEGWRAGRLTGVEGDGAIVVTLDERGDDGAVATLTCGRAEALAGASAGGIAHPRGGHRVLWTVPGRVLAVPTAKRCEGDGTGIVIDHRAIIVEAKREFELLAEDSSWSCRLFEAVDSAALAAAEDEAETKAAARADRSTLFPKLRTSLLPDRGTLHKPE
jgi:hypothetical protein